MTWALWILGLVVPIVYKVLKALGIGVISYAGLNLIFAQIQNAVIANYGAMGATTLQFLALIGVSQAVGIILSAWAARLTLIVIERYAKIAS